MVEGRKNYSPERFDGFVHVDLPFRGHQNIFLFSLSILSAKEVSSCVPVITWLCSHVMRFQSRPINWPLLTIEYPVAQWLEHLLAVVSSPANLNLTSIQPSNGMSVPFIASKFNSSLPPNKSSTFLNTSSGKWACCHFLNTTQTWEPSWIAFTLGVGCEPNFCGHSISLLTHI